MADDPDVLDGCEEDFSEEQTEDVEALLVPEKSEEEWEAEEGGEDGS